MCANETLFPGGTTSVQIRERNCSNPAAKFGGKTCAGGNGIFNQTEKNHKPSEFCPGMKDNSNKSNVIYDGDIFFCSLCQFMGAGHSGSIVFSHMGGLITGRDIVPSQPLNMGDRTVQGQILSIQSLVGVQTMVILGKPFPLY